MPSSERKKISVITTTFNLIKGGRKDVFIEMFKSVHGQTYPNIEHLIIDGGSKDGTIEFINEVNQKYGKKQLVIFSEPDEGITDATNKGFNKSTGDYVILMPSDDYYMRVDALELLANAIEKQKVDFACADCWWLMRNNWKADIKSFVYRHPFVINTWLVKRTVFEKYGFFDKEFKLTADYELFFRILSQKDVKGTVIKKMLTVLRPGGASQGNRALFAKETIMSYRKHISPETNLTNREIEILHTQTPTKIMVEKFLKCEKNELIRDSFKRSLKYKRPNLFFEGGEENKKKLYKNIKKRIENVLFLKFLLRPIKRFLGIKKGNENLFVRQREPHDLPKYYLPDFMQNKYVLNGDFFSFGPKNPDKVFYVIHRSPEGAGFVSNLRFIMRYLAILDKKDVIPIIDTENFHSRYSEEKHINGKKAWWSYFFKDVSDYTLKEVYESKNVFINNGDLYVGQVSNIFYSEDKYINSLEAEAYKKYFIFNDYFLADLQKDDEFINIQESLNKPTLGIQFRGSDMTYEREHLTPATPKQMIEFADKIIKKNDIKQIYIATEVEEYLNFFIKYYKQSEIKILYCNNTYGGIEKLIKTETDDYFKYNSGKDVLKDVICLSKCSAILGVKSNVLILVDFLTLHKKTMKFFIDNGRNFKNIKLNKLRWKFAKLFGSKLVLKILGFKCKLHKDA